MDEKTQRIYVVSFAPSYDESGVGGFEWRRSRGEAVATFAQIAKDKGTDLRLIVLDLPNDLTAEQIDDFLSSGHGCEIIDPPDPRTDLDGAIELWRGEEG